MKQIANAEYNENNQTLVIVYADGDSGFWFARTLKHAWDILRDQNICADIKPTRKVNYGNKDNQKSS